MKRLRPALGLIALLALLPGAITARSVRVDPRLSPAAMTATIGPSCTRYCRDVCIANGEPCCFVGYDSCGCC